MNADRSSKSELELSALRTVLRPEQFYSVTGSDSPDFIVRGSADDEGFGVEVTELFQSEAAARMVRQPNYLETLVGPNPKPHRRDIAFLELTTVQVTSKEGLVKYDELPVVLMKTPTPDERWQAIADRIARKTQSATHYQAGLRFIELVIVDHFPRNGYKGVTPSTTDLLTEPLRIAMNAAPFEEVFVVWRDRKQIYVALRQLILLESFRVFVHALESFEIPSDPNREIKVDEVVPLYIHAIRHSALAHTPPALEYGVVRGIHTAITKGAGIQVNDKSITLLDAHHREITNPIDVPPCSLKTDDLFALVLHLNQMRDDHRLVVDLAFPVENATPLLGSDS